MFLCEIAANSLPTCVFVRSLCSQFLVNCILVVVSCLGRECFRGVLWCVPFKRHDFTRLAILQVIASTDLLKTADMMCEKAEQSYKVLCDAMEGIINSTVSLVPVWSVFAVALDGAVCIKSGDLKLHNYNRFLFQLRAGLLSQSGPCNPRQSWL